MPHEGRMDMQLGVHIQNLLHPEMSMKEVMRRRSELWDSTKKLDTVSGYGGTKNAWIEDMQSLIRRQIGIKSPKVRRKLGGLLPYLLVGEPGSGKTTLGKQLLYRTLCPDSEEDLLAPMAFYGEMGGAEIPINQWTFEWGDACSLIEDPVPDGVDYLADEQWRARKIREIIIASELFGTGLELMAEQANFRALDILLIDAPGGTGIERATPQLSDYINKTGIYSRLNLLLPQVIGLKASAQVIEKNREIRGGMYAFEDPKEMLEYLRSKGVEVDSDEADPLETVERYAKGSATPQQVQMIVREVEEYQARRMRAHSRPENWQYIDYALEMYRRFPSQRQHDLAHFYLPDYLKNVLGHEYPQKSMILSNEVVLPQVAFPADIGSHHPFDEIPGFITEMKTRAYRRIRKNKTFKDLGFTL